MLLKKTKNSTDVQLKVSGSVISRLYSLWKYNFLSNLALQSYKRLVKLFAKQEPPLATSYGTSERNHYDDYDMTQYFLIFLYFIVL